MQVLRCFRCKGTGTDPEPRLRRRIWGECVTVRPDSCIRCHGAGKVVTLTPAEYQVVELIDDLHDEGIWSRTMATRIVIFRFKRDGGTLSPEFEQYLRTEL